MGAGEVGQVVVSASLSNPRYFSTAGAGAFVPYRFLHGAERAAGAERGILPSQPRKARLAYGQEGVGRPATNPLGGFPPHFSAFWFSWLVRRHPARAPEHKWIHSQRDGGEKGWCGGHVRPRAARGRISVPAPPRRAAAANTAAPAAAWCLLRVGPRGQMGGRTGTAGRGCVHGATVPHAARAAGARRPSPAPTQQRPKPLGLLPIACKGLLPPRRRSVARRWGVVAPASKKSKTNGVWSVWGFRPLATAWVGGGGVGPAVHYTALVPRPEGDGRSAVPPAVCPSVRRG